MSDRFHRGFTAAEKTELWDRWKLLERTSYKAGARSTPRSCSGGMNFSSSDFEMQRFESRRPNQPVRLKRVKYEGSLKNRSIARATSARLSVRL